METFSMTATEYAAWGAEAILCKAGSMNLVGTPRISSPARVKQGQTGSQHEGVGIVSAILQDEDGFEYKATFQGDQELEFLAEEIF